MHFVEGFRGWGRGLRRGVGNWYVDRPAQSLAYQAIKYQQRDGWSHRDALRLAHPIAPTDAHNRVFNWVTQGWDAVPTEPLTEDAAHQMLWAFEKAKRAESQQEIIQLVTEYGLPWEAVPTQWLANKEIWEALLPKMGLTAIIRNLGRLTANGLLTQGGWLKSDSDAVRFVEGRLTDPDQLQRARIHPIAVLAAMLTYKNGRGVRGKLTWQPIGRLVDALDDAFYSSFGNVTPSNKRLMLALDVSGSMGWPNLAGVPGLSPRVGSAAMALVTAATEQKVMMQAFSHKFVKLSISPRQRLDGVLKEVDRLNFGATNCALPMVHALENRIPVDAFVIYTDSETWYGDIHPVQALQEYRQKMGIGAKLIVVGMASNGFSIADPNDGGMLDVVGFDTAVPNIMADFIRQ
ncbi:MAG: TROVE domain-containing protein, partial [Chloroflexota bacterium]